MEKQLTIEYLREYSQKHKADIGDILMHSATFLLKYNSRPKKPSLSSNPDVDKAKDYIIEMEKYENDVSIYKEEEKRISQHNSRTENLVEQFIMEHSELNTIVPIQYRQRVYTLAWSRGHSQGFHSVYNELVELIEIFKK